MENVVLQPAPGQTVVATNDDRHSRHESHDWERTILREQAAGFRVESQNHADTMGAVKDARFDLAAVSRDGFTASALASNVTDGLVCESAKDTAIAACKTQDAIAAASKDTAIAAKDGLVTAYQLAGQATLDAAKNAAALQVQADKNSAQMQLQAQTFASAAALQAQTIASAQAAATAECCCELKSLIREDGDKTRALINQGTIDALRARNLEQQTAIAALFSGKVAPVTPIV